MPIELTKEEVADVIPSLRRYCKEELELDISEMRAKFLFNYFLKGAECSPGCARRAECLPSAQIAPFAYNQGVKDAESYFRGRVEDLSGTCFEPALTYWLKKKK
jgi:uncharacterized protein (DUF2164 family)